MAWRITGVRERYVYIYIHHFHQCKKTVLFVCFFLSFFMQTSAAEKVLLWADSQTQQLRHRSRGSRSESPLYCVCVSGMEINFSFSYPSTFFTCLSSLNRETQTSRSPATLSSFSGGIRGVHRPDLGLPELLSWFKEKCVTAHNGNPNCTVLKN